jgi:hypothetical protein
MTFWGMVWPDDSVRPSGAVTTRVLVVMKGGFSRWLSFMKLSSFLSLGRLLFWSWPFSGFSWASTSLISLRSSSAYSGWEARSKMAYEMDMPIGERAANAAVICIWPTSAASAISGCSCWPMVQWTRL